MTIMEMIVQLKEIAEHTGPEEVVRAWCPEGEGYFPVTGFLYGEGGVIDLFTDADEDCQDE